MADLNQMAYRVMQHATEPQEPETPAQASGRKGGLKGGNARAEKLSPEETVRDRPQGGQGTLGALAPVSAICEGSLPSLI